MKKLIYIRILITLLVFLAVWAFWMFAYPAHLHFHEQLQLFEFTNAYFFETITKPAGLAEYLSRFLVQFFYNGAIGPVIVAVVYALIFNAFVVLFDGKGQKERKTFPSQILRYSLALVPTFMLSAFLMGLDAKFTMPIGICIALYAVWLTERFTGRKTFIAITLVLSIVLAFAVGSVFMVYTLMVFGRSALRSLFAKQWKWALGYIIGAVCLWWAIVLLLHQCYPYPLNVLVWGDYYNRFVFIKADYNVLSWWIAITVGLLLTCARGRWYEYVTPLAFVVCGYFTYSEYVAEEESLLENIYLVRMNKWDDILVKYHKHTPSSTYELTGLNLALAMKGQLADSYFHYPQQGAEGLLPVYRMDYMTPLLSAEAYYQMGMVNTAQRFYYESMESIADHQKSAFCLSRLVMTALVNNRVNLAKDYLRKLRNTLYYSEWACDMQRYADNPKLIDTHPQLALMRKMRTKQDSFFDDFNQPPFIAEMLNDYPDNNVAWQYLFTMLMAEGRLDELMQTAQFYTNHFPNAFLPVHVQEALLYTWVTKNNSLNGFPWKVQTAIGQRFMEFAKQANQARDVAEPIVRRDYADTFWCYAVFKAQESRSQSSSTPDGYSGASPQAPRE